MGAESGDLAQMTYRITQVPFGASDDEQLRNDKESEECRAAGR
jgi:hypothetical protein